MRLKIRNFAKISQADIEIDGITIIAGNNNTGKSTVGKILDAAFNATYNINEKMNTARIDSLAFKLRNEVERNRDELSIRGRRHSFQTYRDFAKRLLESEEEEKKEICEEFEEYMLRSLRRESNFSEKVYALLEENKQISDGIFCKAIYTKYFGESFHEQINSLYRTEKVAEIVLSAENKDIQLLFENDECVHEERQWDIVNDSLYIDDPFVLDELNRNFSFGVSEISLHKRNILRKMFQKESREVEEKAFSELLVGNRLEQTVQLINCVADGEIAKKQKYVYRFGGGLSKEIDVASLSTGLKSFLILKQLLLNGNLQDKDVIVLDEPEIHLHPEWQMLYAEIVVLLQKEFNFNIIVTTHSAHFMEALELYSKKHGIAEHCNYYLACSGEEGTTFENATENISKIYKQMVDPTLLLGELREELETEDD